MTFILDTKPNFTESSLKLCGLEYEFKNIKNNGCLFRVYENGVIRDEISFNRQDLKALYLLISTHD